MSKFNPFSVAVAATEKAIKERQKKITNQEQIEKLSVDLEHRAKLLFDIGYAEGQVEHYQGQKKKEAEKRLAELNRQQKQLENAYSKKSTDRLFQLEDEVKALNSSLRHIKYLESQHATLYQSLDFNK
ncbi:TPA: hypothetical protein ACF334_004480 [Vibrio parahaemolyticus]